jgi:signal transduction histidine kinase
MRLRPRYLTIAAADAAAVVTVVLSTIPAVQFAYQSAAVHATIETAAALIAALTAGLVVGRPRHTARAADALLVAGLVCVALAAVVFSVVPWSIIGGGAARITTWTTMIASIAGGALLALAAWMPPQRLSRPNRAAVIALASAAVTVGAAAVVVVVLGQRLPLGIDPVLQKRLSNPHLGSAPSIAAAQAAVAVLYGIASVGFTRRAERMGDEFFAWLGASAIVAAFARVNYVLLPSLYTEWVYVGDLLRLAAFLILLVGAIREISRYQAEATQSAAAEERRRLARDIHDGLAQEIAFIGRNVDMLREPDPEDDLVERIEAAVARAKVESRRVIATLTAPHDRPLESALAEAAQDVAERHGASLDLRLARGIGVSPAASEALVRIACEAIANAARHSGDERVRVDLERSREGLVMRVVDRGRGFDATAPAPSGYGLVSMRERAEALGAKFRILSERNAGTRVEVVL